MGADSSKINCVTVRVAACLEEKRHCLTTPNATDAEIRKAFEESEPFVKSFAHTFHGAGYHYFEYIWRVMEREHHDKIRLKMKKNEKKQQQHQQMKKANEFNKNGVPGKKENDDHHHETIVDIDVKKKEHHADEKTGPITRSQKKKAMNRNQKEDTPAKKKGAKKEGDDNIDDGDEDGLRIGIGKSWSIVSESEKHN